MEDCQTSAPYNNSVEIMGLSDVSYNIHQNELNDNYSQEEIIKLKMHDMKKLVSDLENLFDVESSLPAERTCVEFAVFVKGKSNYISSLINILQETEPFGFPKYRVEAYLKVKETLENVVEDLKVSEKSFKEHKNLLSSRIESSLTRYKVLQEVIDKSIDEKNTAVFIDAISAKLSEEKMNESKNDLNYVMDNMFQANKPLNDLLASLVKASEGEHSDAEEKWIQISNDMDCSYVLFLIQAGIVRRHPKDKTKITLVI